MDDPTIPFPNAATARHVIPPLDPNGAISTMLRRRRQDLDAYIERGRDAERREQRLCHVNPIASVAK